MRWFAKSGYLTKTNGKVKGATNLDDVFADILGRFGVPFYNTCCGTAIVETLTGAGAVGLNSYATLLVTTGANALTLAAGSQGQRKFIKMKTDGGDGTLTPSSLQGGTTITFNDANDFVELVYIDTKWHVIINSGATIA